MSSPGGGAGLWARALQSESPTDVDMLPVLPPDASEALETIAAPEAPKAIVPSEAPETIAATEAPDVDMDMGSLDLPLPLQEGVAAPGPADVVVPIAGEFRLDPTRVSERVIRECLGQSKPFATALLRPYLHTAVCRTQGQSTSDVHPGVHALLQHFVSDAPTVVTKSSLANDLQCGMCNIERHLERIAIALIQAHRSARATFEENLATWEPPPESGISDIRRVAYIDFCRYDETPLPITQHHHEPGRKTYGNTGSQSQTPVPEISADADSAVVEAPRDGLVVDTQAAETVLLPVLGNDAGPQKLFCTEGRFGQLLAYKRNSITRYAAYVGNSLDYLQVLKACDAETFRTALQENCGVTRWSQAFGFKARVAATDKHAANIRVERALAKRRGHEWASLHAFCRVHIIATGHGKCFRLTQLDISGLVNFAPSLRHGPELKKFRRAFAQVVAERLEIRKGHPPLDTIVYRQNMLDLFLSRGRDVEQRKFVLKELPNGDWRDKSHVQVYLADEEFEKHSRADVANRLAKGLMSALTGRSFFVYPRHRWVGADIAVDEIGLLEACHGLASATYRQYLIGLEKKKEPAKTTGRNAPALAWAAIPIGPDAPEPAGVAEARAPAAAPEVPPSAWSRTPTGEPDWPKINAEQRRKAAEWLRSGGPRCSVLARLVIDYSQGHGALAAIAANDDGAGGARVGDQPAS